MMANEESGPVKLVKARGKALRRTTAQLDNMTSAKAMRNLVEEAADDFQENAPKEFKNLLGEKR